MKLGICGTGKIVKEVLPLLSDIKERYGTYEEFYLFAREESSEKAKRLEGSCPIEKIFYRYEELLSSDVEMLYLALPNNLHFAYAKEALLAGKHVLLEKPLCISLKEFQELKDLSIERHCLLLEAMNIYFLPAFWKLKAALSSLGPLRMVSLNFTQYSSRYDAFLEGDIKPCFDRAFAGGALMDLGIYNIAFCAALFGKPRAIRYLPVLQRGIDTSGVLTLDYETFIVSSIAAKDCCSPALNTLQGEKGAISFTCPVNQLESFQLSLRNAEGATEEEKKLMEQTENDKDKDNKDTNSAALEMTNDLPSHRLYAEFLAFPQILKAYVAEDEKQRQEMDGETIEERTERKEEKEGMKAENKSSFSYQELLSLTETCQEILEEARKAAGISFA